MPRLAHFAAFAAVGAACFASAAVAHGRVYFSSCNLQGAHDRAYEPSVIAFGGNSYIVHLRWSDWNDRVAHARGTLELNNCLPDCAGGTITSWAVAVSLSDINLCGGVDQYVVMTFSYVGAVPRGYTRSYRQNFRNFCETS